MMLLLDIGNTRLKAALSENNKVEIFSSVSHCGDWVSVIASLDIPSAVNNVHIASVVGSSNESVIAEAVLKKAGVDPVFHQAASLAAGVRNGYRSPVRLGVDRWMAIVAACQRAQGAVCVVDCGTTITIDMVTAKGDHKGGFILPGLAMSKKSLLQGTKEIKLGAEEHCHKLAWGCSTEEAVCHGALFSSVASIERAMRDFKVEEGGVALFLTGGDASVIAKYLHYDELIPELVLEGILCSATLNV
ncbi:MAG: type III pantothenate kinase [Pseudomonadales bacterium]|nr:type III pantothenate kinase [Pseudomonadales bacterium]